MDAFLESFRRLPGDEKNSALIQLKDKLSKGERFDLRRVLEVNAPDELSAEAVAEVSKQQWSLLAAAMRERAKDMKRADVDGAAGWVTTGATLAPVDFRADLDFKRRIAPVPMAVIEGVIKSTNHHLDLDLQKKFLERVDLEGHVERDGRLFRLVGSEEREVHFNYHGRPHTLSWVRKEVADRGGSIVARVSYISDALVASWNHGQEVITPVILRLSAAATQWLSEHSFDLFSSLGALLPRTTSVAVVDEIARLYDGAFVADTIRFAKATSSGGSKPCACSSQCDNYVAGGRVARHVKLKNNYREVATETRMFGFVRNNTLESGDGGYGKDRFSCDMIRDMFLEIKAELGLVCSGVDGESENQIWSLKLESLTSAGFKWAELFVIPDLPKDEHKPYRIRDHTLAPQVEACSANRMHFRLHLIEWAKDLFADEWKDVHMFFVFDTEYIPHYISWIERSPDMREIMKNTAVLPCKFHVRKHLSETLLARKTVLRNVLTELLTTVLVTSKKKWELIKREADADAGAAAAAAPEALAELLDVIDEAANDDDAVVRDDDDEEEEEEGEEEGVAAAADAAAATESAAVAAAAAAVAADDDAVRAAAREAEDKAFAEELRPSLTEMKHVRQLKAEQTRKLSRGLGLGDVASKYQDLHGPIIDKLELRPDYGALYEAERPGFVCKADLSSSRGVSAPFLRWMCEENGIPTTRTEGEEGEEKEVQVKRAELELKLARKLGLHMKRPRKQKEFNEKVKMNLHRLNQLLFFMLFRWDGEKWGGSCIRKEIIQMCKKKYGSSDGMEELSDEDAVKKACEESSYFTGLWIFFDVEVRMCVEPFIDWENGDVTLFLALFPVMCAYVASSHKTKIPKVFLMLFERLRQLKEKHPNAVKLFAANCSLFDEEKVEFMNAKLGRWIKARIKDLGIGHYRRTSSIMKGVQEIDSSFSELLNRKESEVENMRLRRMYLAASWDETNEALHDYIVKKFDECMDGGGSADWPRETFLTDGLVRTEKKFLPELRKWIAQQQGLEEESEEEEVESENEEALMADDS